MPAKRTKLQLIRKPRNRVFRLAKCRIDVRKHQISKVTYAIPAACILRVATKFVKSVSPVRAAENIYADVFTM